MSLSTSALSPPQPTPALPRGSGLRSPQHALASTHPRIHIHHIINPSPNTLLPAHSDLGSAPRALLCPPRLLSCCRFKGAREPQNPGRTPARSSGSTRASCHVPNHTGQDAERGAGRHAEAVTAETDIGTGSFSLWALSGGFQKALRASGAGLGLTYLVAKSPPTVFEEKR